MESASSYKGGMGESNQGVRRKAIRGRTEEETFPDFEEVGLCEVAAGR